MLLEQLMGNPAAPYLNSLMTPGNPNAAQTSWASNYYNAAAGVHPSLPNYLWQEAGTNFGVNNDNQPFGPGGENQGNAASLTGLLQAKRHLLEVLPGRYRPEPQAPARSCRRASGPYP